ncbi:hypothetical protein LSAT2_030019 [Lamellibrachia satsuma]|nr:hypothetical protein LSAT2_030019 [Lamellibrachia satsuma]
MTFASIALLRRHVEGVHGGAMPPQSGCYTCTRHGATSQEVQESTGEHIALTALAAKTTWNHEANYIKDKSWTGRNVAHTKLGALPSFDQAYGGPNDPAACAVGHQCALCGKSFSSRQRCLRHQAQHQPSSGIGLRCVQCSATFVDFAHLVAHARTHAAAECCFPCKVCGKVFDKSSYLTQHMKMHSQPQYKCPTCERRFFWRAGRNRHAKMCAAGDAYRSTTSPYGPTPDAGSL